MPNAQPGWYRDPWDAAPFRWWDGQVWTAATRMQAPVTLWRALPWRRWSIWLLAIGLTGFVCFKKMESSATRNPETWFYVGLGIIATLAFLAAFVTLRRRRWIEVLILSGLIAGFVSLAIFVTAAPSSSRSCNARSDCDTSFGVGLAFVAVALAVPTVPIVALGKALSDSAVRRR